MLRLSHTSEAFKYPAHKLNELSGGSEQRSGLIDVSPEILEHWYEFATGGVGRLLSRSWNTLENVASGKGIDPEKLPFARLYIGQDQSYEDRNLYYKIKDEVETAERELKARSEDGDREAVSRIVKKYRREIEMIGDVDTVEKRLAKLRKERRATQAMPDIGEARRQERIEAIDTLMDSLMTNIRKRWNERRELETAQ